MNATVLQSTALSRKLRKPFDLMGFVKRRFWVTLILGTIGFVCLAPLALIKSQPYYQVKAKLLVAPVMPVFLSRSEDSSITPYFRDYMTTQEERIRELDILGAALKRLSPENQRWFMPSGTSPDAAAGRLASQLEVKQYKRSQLIQLALTGNSPQGLAELTNMIMQVYLEKTQSEEENKDTRRLDFLHQERVRLAEETGRLVEELKRLAEETRTSDFIAGADVHTQKLITLQEAYYRTYADRLEKENRLKALEKQAAELKALPIDAAIKEMIVNDNSLYRIDFWTYTTLQDMRKTLDGLSAENPDRRYVEMRMKNMNEYLESHRDRVSRQASEIIQQKRDVSLTEEVIRARSSVEAAYQTEKELLKQLSGAQENAIRNAQSLLQGQHIQAKLEFMKDRSFQIETRIQDIAAESKAPLRVTIESDAKKPTRPAGSNATRLFLVAFVLAYGSVGGIMLVMELMDNRIRRPRDVETSVGSPSTWPISRYESTDRGRAFAPTASAFDQVTRYDPHHVVSRALRSLAIRLNRERQENGAKTMLFTGVNEKSGVTGILLNSAAVLGQMCERVLIVDMNLSSPAISDALESQLKSNEMKAASCRIDYPGNIFRHVRSQMDLLPLGHMDWGMGTGERLFDMLKALKTEYDVILIDAQPVLTSDLTEFLCTVADVAVLVIQGDRSLYSQVVHTVDILLKLDIPALASVLNWGSDKPANRIQALMDALEWSPGVIFDRIKGKRLKAEG
ncbi:MAG: GumC family protein [Desulfatirhabdiaceae bacterium]